MFSKHKSIERFSVIFISLSLMMAVLMVTIVARKKASDAISLSNRAMYTTTVTLSRSHVSGEVVDVMTNSDRTKAFVLLKMSSMDSLSADAGDYIMFLTGSNENQGRTDLKSQPSGGIYVFGTSGYMGVYLVNHEAYESQILNLVIRATKDYSTTDGSNWAEVPSNGDTSFQNYDQMQIYFNPGASGATHADFLDAETLDVEDMYKEAVVEAQESEIRATLQGDLQSMFDQRRLSENYLSRLVKGIHGMVIAEPDMPDAIATDRIVAYTHSGDKELTWDDDKNSWIDSEGKKYTNEEYYLKLKTDYDFEGGYNFDWQTTSFKTGWIDELRGSMTETEYLAKQDALLAETAKSGELAFDASSVEFYTGSGELFDGDENSSDSMKQSIASDITKLLASWQSYYDTKVKYETEDLKSLLYLERDARTASATYTENFGEGVLTNY